MFNESPRSHIYRRHKLDIVLYFKEHNANEKKMEKTKYVERDIPKVCVRSLVIHLLGFI